MMANKAYALRIDAGDTRRPVSEPRPRLSWAPPTALAHQSRYVLEATIDGVALPPVTRDSANHLFVPWPWPALTSKQLVTWRVKSDSAVSPGGWSDWHTFQAGLFANDWVAQWISPVEAQQLEPGNRPAYVLERSFQVDKDVASATFYASALGVYEVLINGSRVGDIELAPGNTSYDHTLYAQSYDATDALRHGDNDLAIVLSDGWYRGQVGAFRIPADWGPRTGARGELHVTYTDGSTCVVATDSHWHSTRSQIVRADLMDGQTVDFTAARGESDPVQVSAVEAPAPAWSPAPPVRVVETREPHALSEIRPGVWIADFGQNASGWIALDRLGPLGTQTTFEYGEHLDSAGDLTTAHLDSSRPGEATKVFIQRDVVVSSGAGEIFEPRHTVHGFQYVRITQEGGALRPTDMRMKVVHSDFARTGSFSSSDSDLNRLHEMATWSFRGNAVDVPTDCPTRERLAWTGDYQVFAPSAVRLYDVLGFTRKWLQSVRDDQLADGRIANFSPDGRRIKNNLDDQFAMMTGSAGWGDAIVAVPWEMYRAYGDIEILAENWDAMKRWLEWAADKARTERHHSRQARSAEPQPHEQYIWDGTFHWGEWIEPVPRAADGSRANPITDNPMEWFMADKGEVGTAFLYRSTSTLAAIARILGHVDEADRYSATAEQIRDAWITEFLDDQGMTQDNTQASYVRALSFGLVPQELREATTNNLLKRIQDADHHLATGFLSTGDLLPVLADNGHADTAHDLLFTRTAPSWLYMADQGATTVWEDWEGVDEHGHAHESLNHYSKGAVVKYLHSHTLGLRQSDESIAWNTATVKPVPAPGVTWAQGEHVTPRGPIAVRWERSDSGFSITIAKPASVTMEVTFPDGFSERVEGTEYSVTRPC